MITEYACLLHSRKSFVKNDLNDFDSIITRDFLLHNFRQLDFTKYAILPQYFFKLRSRFNRNMYICGEKNKNILKSKYASTK